MKTYFKLLVFLLLCTLWQPQLCKADEVSFVNSLFDFLYEDASPDPAIEEVLSKAMPDVVAVLHNTKRYQNVTTPILTFLRSERDEIFHSTERERIVVFSPARIVPASDRVENASFVHAFIGWDRSSPTPPVKVVQFWFENGQLAGPPRVIAAPESKTIYDFALEKRDALKTE